MWKLRGTVVCKGCGQTRMVYARGPALHVDDHEVPESMRPAWRRQGEMVRCSHAGREIMRNSTWDGYEEGEVCTGR